jgi:hypothetical protein
VSEDAGMETRAIVTFQWKLELLIKRPPLVYNMIDYIIFKKETQRFCVLFSTLPLRFSCVGGCWDGIQDCCDVPIEVRASNHKVTSHHRLHHFLMKKLRDLVPQQKTSKHLLDPN